VHFSEFRYISNQLGTTGELVATKGVAGLSAIRPTGYKFG
jgi:hypothetical protein